MAKDYVTGKKTTFGNKRSHSLNSTRRAKARGFLLGFHEGVGNTLFALHIAARQARNVCGDARLPA